MSLSTDTLEGPAPWRRTLIGALRRLGLIGLADIARRAYLRRKNAEANQAFLAANPDFAAPPPALLYEVSGAVSYPAYAASGRAACEALAAHAEAVLDTPLARVLDWGVGPARVARWWPSVQPGVEIWGGDPWAEVIAWGQSALPELKLRRLPALPPTEFEDGVFDFAYGISILTHLPLGAQKAWLEELHRIVRPGGAIALTLQGRQALSRFSPQERAAWDAGEMVERAQVKEGSRLYLAYHPPAFARDVLFAGWEILLHEPDSAAGSGGQDLWLLRRA